MIILRQKCNKHDGVIVKQASSAATTLDFAIPQLPKGNHLLEIFGASTFDTQV